MEVSFLTNFEKATNIWDWEMMKHGIEIEFNKNGRNYRSTYLPDVAEHFSTKEEMMENLIHKAGWTRKGSSVYDDI